MYTIEQVSPEDFKNVKHHDLVYDTNPEYGVSIRIHCGINQVLLIHIEPDYKEKPKVFVALK